MERPNAWLTYSDADMKDLETVAKKYRHFLNVGKTERECITQIVKEAEEAGYVSFEEKVKNGEDLKAGDKVYQVGMQKIIALYHIGEDDLAQGMNILCAHIDSPRLDIKQNPLYEDTDLAYLDTHYYGGVKKYQWVALPMAMHGVIVKKDGTVVNVTVGEDEDDPSTPETFRKKTVLSQHLSFLRDFFRAYKDFTDPQIDTIEILLSKLYSKFHISDYTNFAQLKPEDYPVLSDLYDLIEEEYKNYDEAAHNLYTPQLLQEVLLGLNSICKGADSEFFNGHTNITSSRFLVFGVKSLLMAGRNIQNAMLFNILSYMSDKLLTEGNTVATLDELYIWLSNPTAIEYIRNCLKRVRKKESAMILASQNLDDFDQPNVREMTKPLFSIPPHQFLFNAGSIDKRSYMDMLQLEESEYDLIRYPQRGVCLYKCGNERYLLEVHAPPHKETLFGTAGGR